jgi:hypothetical protein
LVNKILISEKMFHLGRQDMAPLSLESLAFNKLIRNKKIRKKTPTLVAPLMKQWLNLVNIVSDYLVIFTTTNIMDASGMSTTKCELLERGQEEAQDGALPCCFDNISLTGMGLLRDWHGLAPGIELTCSREQPTLFAWGQEYNYDIAGCSFTRVYYKDGEVIKENWFLEEDNSTHTSTPHLQQPPPVKWLLISRDALKLCVDGALIWHISKFIRGGSDHFMREIEDLTMTCTAKACRITYSPVHVYN